RTDRKLTDRLRRAARDADSIEALHAALDPVIDRNATPDLVPGGAMVLQPSEERRRSGSHYTPRELTEPIVRTALAPIFERLRSDGNGPLRAEQILDLKVCDPAMGSGAFLVEACRQLGDALVEAWRAHDAMPEIPPDENEIIFARRQVAQRCLYGVDRNPKAVDLAKLSLWLVTLAKDHPLTFLDHALRPGDALVGLSRKELEAFHWKVGAKPFQAGFEAMRAHEHLTRARELRRRVREADDSVSELELRHLCDDSRREAENVRLFGDLVLAAFFEGSKPKQREDLRRQLADAVERDETHRYLGWIEEIRRNEPPLAPFHWEIEFPEVFERENPGFDAVVGNPPFAGKNTVAAANVAGYPDWLKQMHEESHGNADLVAHFFRRAFGLLRTGGTAGLIATNTIAQGDTRSTGLRWICKNGGEIYGAQRRVRWPGLAAVVVSVLHVHKGRFPGVKRLDGEAVDTITAFLFHRGGHDDPARLEANAGKSFQGSIVLGMGFTFDDTDKKGVASPLAEMHRLIAEDPSNQDVIFPYIGGEEVNTNPTHAHHRYVINFRDWPLRREVSDAPAQAHEARNELTKQVMAAPTRDRHAPFLGVDNILPSTEGEGGETASDPGGIFAPPGVPGESPDSLVEDTVAETSPDTPWADADQNQRRAWLRTGIAPWDYPEPVAADWQELLAIVRHMAKPDRDRQNRKALRERWWHYAEKRPGLYAAIGGLDRVLAIPQTSNVQALVFLSPQMVFGHTLIVFPLDTHSAFAVLQSRIHQIWSAFLGPTMKDDLRYTPSDCFETFPFPDDWHTHPVLEHAGADYYRHRADLMVRHDEGLTRTYNRFHDPAETDPDIATLRDLHAAMDRAVLDAYGWTDISTDCKFLLDYAINEEAWGTRKKPYRYRWPDEIRDEVLARLLALNAERATEESRAGTDPTASPPGVRGPRKTRLSGRQRPGRTHAVAESRTLWDAAVSRESDIGDDADGSAA
ncbi:MAG: N-6 DNA methylase, partial [Thiotrichales bacterium]|nr:N-6 DNA methylase [Thiotrichales bacterium]